MCGVGRMAFRRLVGIEEDLASSLMWKKFERLVVDDVLFDSRSKLFGSKYDSLYKMNSCNDSEQRPLEV